MRILLYAANVHEQNENTWYSNKLLKYDELSYIYSTNIMKNSPYPEKQEHENVFKIRIIFQLLMNIFNLS